VAVISSQLSTHRCPHVNQKEEREMLRTFNKITLFPAPVIVSPLSSLSLLIYSSSILSYPLTSQAYVSKRQISNSDATVNAGGDEVPGLTG
jgi:hypothetical protein